MQSSVVEDSGTQINEEKKSKERKLFIILFIWFYIAGVEYGFIVSTVNSYLNQLGAPSYYLGQGFKF